MVKFKEKEAEIEPFIEIDDDNLENLFRSLTRFVVGVLFGI